MKKSKLTREVINFVVELKSSSSSFSLLIHYHNKREKKPTFSLHTNSRTTKGEDYSLGLFPSSISLDFLKVELKKISISFKVEEAWKRYSKEQRSWWNSWMGLKSRSKGMRSKSFSLLLIQLFVTPN